ncbi:related to YFH1-mitochondrial matrix iron chaperone [Sporisorium reilianum f. sp. reilianum]|uniref:Related to YFH1-mitochondrial matrix iron chaperone n=1 Tax=Sporisorium reilianum f. sp. reilianum TaxID=72559 RepID=A0A2N8UIW8_9BASI|nr:related to YFH1-mitochondrial matrix iron chaperone [Sporisorium reilianum f. sp. reilianum]
MKLPMMLRTTTQRGLLTSAPLRAISSRSATALGLRDTLSRSQVKVVAARTPFLPHTSIVVRSFSTSQRREQPTTKYTASPLTDGEYHKLSNTAIDSLTETFEVLLEEADVEALEEQARAKHQGATRGSPAAEWDIECASGVMNLRCGVHGTWVINKQPPNKQIWLSSPKSGPKRFDYDADSKTWFCHKEGETSTLHELLQEELSQVFDTQVEVVLEED